MVDMILNHEAKLNSYWSYMRAFLTLFGAVFLLSGCNTGIEGATFTLKKFDEKNFLPLMQTIAATSWTIGAFLIISGFFKLKVYGQTRTMMSSHASILPSLMYLGVGVGLFYIPFLTETSLYTIWGANDVLAYPGNGETNNAWTTYFRPIVHIMTLIGYVSFIRGWLMLTRLGKEGGQQPGTASRGFMHIFGGLLAINFLGTVNIIKHSFI